MREKPYFNAVHYQSDNVITTLAGGINNVTPAEFIADDEVQEMENFSLDKYPAACTKIGRTYFRNPGISGKQIKYFGNAGLNYLFYIQESDEANADPNDTTTYYILKDVAGQKIYKQLTGTSYKHAYYKDGNNEYLIIYGDGQQALRFTLPLSSLETPTQITFPIVDGVQVVPENMVYHKSRMFISVGDMLYFSALQNPLDWTTPQDSGYIKVTNAKGTITGIVSFDDKMVIFSQSNMHLLYGDSVGADSNTNFQIVDLDNNIGSYGSQLAVHNGLLYWLYARSIYEYNGSSIRNIEKPTGSNGVTGGIQEYIDGILYTEAQNVSIAGSDTKVYFYFPNYKGKNRFLVFDQRLRKWTQEIQPVVEGEGSYINIVGSFNSINFSQTPEPIYGLTSNGVIYEITGGKRVGTSYIKLYGEDEYVGTGGIVKREPIPFYLKSKQFTEGGVSKKKTLKELWLSYDLEGEASIKITNGDETYCVIDKQLEQGTNIVKCFIVPYKYEGMQIQNKDSYYIEIIGKGNITINQLERKFRIKPR